MPDCNDCPVLPRVEALEKEMQHNKDAHKGFYVKLEESHTAVALIKQQLDHIKEDTEDIKETVQEMKDKPGKRLETFIAGIISALGGAFVMWVAMGMPGAGS